MAKTLIYTTAPGSSSFTDSTAAPNTNYTYEVRTVGLNSGPTAQVTTPEDVEPSPSVGPQPQPGDRILYDNRTTLQQANNFAEANALFIPYETVNFAFTSNVDGKGTKAMRADFTSWGGVCRDTSAQIDMHLPTPYPHEVYIQYKTIIGRTATGGGLGQIGRFQITNPNCGSGGNAGAKRLLVYRDVFDQGSLGRTDLLWPGAAPPIPRVASDSESWTAPSNRATYNPQEHEGEVMVWTVYLRSESSQGAKNGAVRVWVNDLLIIERTDVPARTEAFRSFKLPATFNSPQLDQSEYFWDIVAWEPK